METPDLLRPNAADASVRPAQPGDAAAIGAVQVRCWRRDLAGIVPDEALRAMQPGDLAAGWRSAITAPPSDRYAVLVACTGPAVVGFTALAPSADADATAADAELIALEVDPAHHRAGHGSRLLAAAAETAVRQGYTALRVWVPERDAIRRAFFASAGPQPDGVRRRLSLGPDGDTATTVSEERLSASLPV